MKRLDLSCMPINLEVGETMEVIDERGKRHLIRCEQAESNNSLCDSCFFYKINSICNYVKCSERERGQEVRYVEIPVEYEIKEENNNNMKTLDFDTIAETDKIKAGETFIYVDCLGVQHKVIAKKVGTLGDCKRCVFNNDACCLVKCSNSGRESKDDVYFEEIY